MKDKLCVGFLVSKTGKDQGIDINFLKSYKPKFVVDTPIDDGDWYYFPIKDALDKICCIYKISKQIKKMILEVIPEAKKSCKEKKRFSRF